MSEPVYYFGRHGVPGHSVHSPHGAPRLSIYQIPWGPHIDGGLLNDAGIPDKVEGHAIVAWKDGWTSVSFWDRSGDSRSGSLSAFLMRGTVMGEMLMKLAVEQWPDIFNRSGFIHPVVYRVPHGSIYSCKT